MRSNIQPMNFRKVTSSPTSILSPSSHALLFISFAYALNVMTAITTSSEHYDKGVVFMGAPSATIASTSAAAAFALIPSQIPSARHGRPKKKRDGKTEILTPASRDAWILQSHYLEPNDSHDEQHFSNDDHDDDDSVAGDQVVYHPPSTSTLRSWTPSTTPSTAKSTPSRAAMNETRKVKLSIPRTGNLPDVNW